MIPRELRDAEDIFLCATLRCAAGFISRGVSCLLMMTQRKNRNRTN